VELLRATGLECHYGARTIFSALDCTLNEGERVALVGPNGAGKSSLLRLLAGVEIPFGGTIVRAKDARLGYLAQSVADETEATLAQLVDAALARVHDAEWGLKNKRLRTMLDGFGFGLRDFDRPLREFSGGQRAKAALAHLLIDDPDYLILDEPTNHLDIATVRWLESFVANDRRAYVVVSHDRYFIDRVATRVWEIERGRFHIYAPAQPAYTAFLAMRDVREAKERADYDAFVEERDKRRATIAGLRATHTSSDYSQVRSREKQLARVEAGAGEVAQPSPAQVRIGVRLDAGRRATSGFAFEVSHLSKAYAHPLFADVTFALQQGSRLAVVGPNGSGKSTMLKILAEMLPADAGTVRYNPAVRHAYFAQSAHEQLDVDASAVDAVLAAGAGTPEDARSLLGRMRISGDAADKPVRAFSGGERRRIMLARLMARKADVLLLDEPTNDLDIASREALEDVLDAYEGAIVVVSHDRYLLGRLADRVLWIDGGAWGVLEGGYDAYETMQREREARARAMEAPKERNAQSSRLTPLKVRSQATARVARIERDLASLETRKGEIERLFADPALYEDRSRTKELHDELEIVVERSAKLVEQWEEALHELEALGPV
jgi:ATP-binding cassette subfamily F protein 3